MVLLFSRVGIPEEILTDQGSNFMTTLLQEIYQLLGITPSPYHPQTDGLVERFNGAMMKKFTYKDWDEYLRICSLHIGRPRKGFLPLSFSMGDV